VGGLGLGEAIIAMTDGARERLGVGTLLSELERALPLDREIREDNDIAAQKARLKQRFFCAARLSTTDLAAAGATARKNHTNVKMKKNELSQPSYLKLFSGSLKFLNDGWPCQLMQLDR
jgi:hypothetical protein